MRALFMRNGTGRNQQADLFPYRFGTDELLLKVHGADRQRFQKGNRRLGEACLVWNPESSFKCGWCGLTCESKAHGMRRRSMPRRRRRVNTK